MKTPNWSKEVTELLEMEQTAIIQKLRQDSAYTNNRVDVITSNSEKKYFITTWSKIYTHKGISFELQVSRHATVIYLEGKPFVEFLHPTSHRWVTVKRDNSNRLINQILNALWNEDFLRPAPTMCPNNGDDQGRSLNNHLSHAFESAIRQIDSLPEKIKELDEKLKNRRLVLADLKLVLKAARMNSKPDGKNGE